MKRRKERLTVTVDPSLIEAATEAVKAGRADSLSGWVNLALTERADKERRLQALADAVAAYERKFGEISAEELEQQARLDRQAAIVVRGKSRAQSRRRRQGTA
jgi:glycerol dehydrogenase-like iron-containing ADH family enzyme